jgi:hypothetical protein
LIAFFQLMEHQTSIKRQCLQHLQIGV